MRVAFAADDRTPVTEGIVAALRAGGHEVVECGHAVAWPDAGRAVGEAVASDAADVGIVCCWTGTGVSIAANKVHGVRAALCTDAETARGARKWNDANVLALGLRLTTSALAGELIDAFLSTSEDGSETANIAKLES